MAGIRKFFAYELEEDGDRKELFFPESDLGRNLNPEQVLIIVREDLRRIFIWRGAESPVKKRFISSRVAQQLKQEDPSYHLCKIISVDQGDEPQEFLDAFNLESMEVKERLADMRYVRNKDRTKKKEIKIYPEEKEYRISELITLKLIKGKTEIYIDGSPFHQCKYLLLNLTQKDFTNFDQIDSIDEAFEVYNKLDKTHEGNYELIDPESEFIGHCSNLQAWYEHGYDLRILHSSLSLPLLKKLAFLGDKKAIIRLKESIATRIASKNFNTILFYLNEKYLKLFSNEELEVIFDEWLEKNIDFTFMEKRRLWYPLLKELIERGITRAQKIIKKEMILFLEEDNYDAYRYLLMQGFVKLLNLEALEEVYKFIPKTDMGTLRHLESLILKATLRKRKNLKKES